VSTTPKFVEPNDNGVFSAFFTVPDTVIGAYDVAAADKYDADIAAGESFTVTPSETITGQQSSAEAATEPPNTSTLPF
jgi:hypothetical protein